MILLRSKHLPWHNCLRLRQEPCYFDDTTIVSVLGCFHGFTLAVIILCFKISVEAAGHGNTATTMIKPPRLCCRNFVHAQNHRWPITSILNVTEYLAKTFANTITNWLNFIKISLHRMRSSSSVKWDVVCGLSLKPVYNSGLVFSGRVTVTYLVSHHLCWQLTWLSYKFSFILSMLKQLLFVHITSFHFLFTVSAKEHWRKYFWIPPKMLNAYYWCCVILFKFHL